MNTAPIIDAISFSIEGDWIVISIWVGGELFGKPKIPLNFFVESFLDWLGAYYGENETSS